VDIVVSQLGQAMWLTAPGGSLDFLGGSKSTRPACVRPARSLLPFGAGRLCSGSGRHHIGEPRASGLVKAGAPPGGAAILPRRKASWRSRCKGLLVRWRLAEGFTDGEMAAGHTYEIKDVPGEW